MMPASVLAHSPRAHLTPEERKAAAAESLRRKGILKDKAG